LHRCQKPPLRYRFEAGRLRDSERYPHFSAIASASPPRHLKSIPICRKILAFSCTKAALDSAYMVRADKYATSSSKA
jgi:hypothetical protein